MLLGRGFFRKRPGQHEFGLEHGSGALHDAVEGGPHPGAPDVAADAGRFDLPGIALVPRPIELFSRPPELDDEVAGEVLRLGLAPFLAPEADQGGFIVAHDDPGVGAANKAASICQSYTLTICLPIDVSITNPTLASLIGILSTKIIDMQPSGHCQQKLLKP